MKKIILVLMIMVYVLCFAAISFALDPLTPAVEGYVISHTTEIEVDGDCIMEEHYTEMICEGTITVSVEDPGPGVVYIAPTNAGEISYHDENRALGGLTNLIKTFSASPHSDTSTNDNVETSKLVSYLKDPLSLVGSYTAEETGGVRVFQNNGIQWNIVNEEQEEYICVLACEKQREIVMGSEMEVTLVSASTKTNLNLYGDRVSGYYDIEASGEGTIGTGVTTLYRENDWRVVYDGGCDIAGRGHPGMEEGAGQMDYSDFTEASGIISSFKKTMEVKYDVEITTAVPRDFMDLCPFNQQGD